MILIFVQVLLKQMQKSYTHRQIIIGHYSAIRTTAFWKTPQILCIQNEWFINFIRSAHKRQDWPATFYHRQAAKVHGIRANESDGIACNVIWLNRVQCTLSAYAVKTVIGLGHCVVVGYVVDLLSSFIVPNVNCVGHHLGGDKKIHSVQRRQQFSFRANIFSFSPIFFPVDESEWLTVQKMPRYIQLIEIK